MKNVHYQCYNIHMIVGVDIGGTKTLLALFTESGKILKEVRFETSQSYSVFLKDLSHHARIFETQKAKIACVAVPGSIDFDAGLVLALGNLPWRNKPIQADISRVLGVDMIRLENDANLAGLAEAIALPKRHKLVLYITLSTGIGSGIIINNRIVPELSGSEAGQMMVYNKSGILHRWETFASGKALFQSTGQQAMDIEEDDDTLWSEYVENVCLGLQPAISVLRPQVVILGGGVGSNFDKFKNQLIQKLESLNHSRTYVTPTILGAKYKENSVIYGCYEYAKEKLS